MTGAEHVAAALDGIEASTWSYQRWGDPGNLPDYRGDLMKSAVWEMGIGRVHAELAIAAAIAEMIELLREAVQ